ncbi:hypothetical protein [Peribacillus asahii]|uniref:hypothetical protein n=1 Tax=Peribacillus asahii TaxID=228899 RepID=UPI00207AA321|nr:hypothetical protein [Peribacillus asahii]USK72650.1 hypothetical protein LIS76_23275 [Peribacillus asahii]USK72688.1 hypothetical protein LIS76_23860 [Peribacillus asahii]
MSKAEDFKAKMRQETERKQERNARKELMEKDTAPVKQEETYTITIDKLVLELKHPEQTFGTKLDRTELIGCFFEPKVAKAFKADQKKKGRGWQSHLVNELVKQYYQDKGMI